MAPQSTSSTPRVFLVSLLIVALAALAHAVAVAHGGGSSAEATDDHEIVAINLPAVPPRAPAPTPTFAMPECDVSSAPDGVSGATGSPEARAAAQQGLDFLAEQTPAWTSQHACFGCHVHAVTLEAFTVGRSNHYAVAETPYATVLEGLLDLPGGARTEAGLSYHGNSLFQPSRASGGAALARYDELVGPEFGDELVRTAGQLLEHQREDGSIDLQYDHPPVFVGDLTGTALAIRTWVQAYARTADPAWQTAAQAAEGFLRATQARWTGSGTFDDAAPPSRTQEINYAIIGLVAAGASQTEQTVASLQRLLLERQNSDGGWGDGDRSASNALVTGQTVYALRTMGMTDLDQVVAGGMGWLMEHQLAGGGWSSAGSSKAEAMWGILGLVTLDVMTVDVAGIENGERVGDDAVVEVRATDNGGGVVVQTEILVDDVLAYGGCKDNLSWHWNTRSLADGPHTVDVVATNASGEVSRRRFTVFSGDVFLTRIGTRYEDGATSVTLRNLGPSDPTSSVELEIFEVREEGDVPSAGTRLWSSRSEGVQGAMQFRWTGETDGDDGADSGRYVARLSYRPDDGSPVQVEETLFFHDTEANRMAAYGAVAGQLAGEGRGELTNATIELVDEVGNVVQSTITTSTGAYRFDNVDDREYRVRVRRQGFAPVEQPVAASPGEVATEDLQMMAE